MIRLARREKLLAAGLVVFIVLWSLFTVAVKPALARIETLDRIIPEHQQELEKVRAISEKYILLSSRLNNLHTNISSQKETMELLPFLESLIEECGLAKNLDTMKRDVLQIDSNYSEIIVEVRLESLSLGELVDFLHKIESSQVRVRTKSIYIKRNMVNKNLLDSVVEIHNTKFSQNEFAGM
jgi:type II secretory pathway component PulM